MRKTGLFFSVVLIGIANLIPGVSGGTMALILGIYEDMMIALKKLRMGYLMPIVAGAVVAPIYVVQPLMWMHPLTIILAIVVLGGLGSIKGSIIAAFILAFAETAVVFLAPGGSFLRGVVSLIIMVVVLQIRPEGLYGIVFEEERL